jgi:PEP-CTERM motif-containing protein
MIDNKFTRVLTIALCLAVTLFATRASAVPVTWNESGDAGNTPGTAQTPIGTGQLDIIIATLSPATDTDVFRIYIPNPDIFALNMIGTALTPYEALGNDTEVYVLNEVGNLVFNHDGADLAQVNAGQLAGMPAGVYLIAYNLFSSVPTNSQLNPVIGWDVNPYKSQTGTVYLNLTGAEFVAAPIERAEVAQAVPEPSSVLLLGLGLIGIARRFKKTNS